MKDPEEVKRKSARISGRNLEYRVAKKLGGVRVGRSKAVKVDGKWIQTDCQKPPDVVTPVFSVECKAWKRAPESIKKLMTQALANCPECLTPIGCIYDKEEQVYYWIWTSPYMEEWHVGVSK